LPRDLADVLHYFLPELESEVPRAPGPPRAAGFEETPDAGSAPAKQSARGLPLPILGVPIGDRDVVRAALAWNLAIETARLGGAAVLVAPSGDVGSPLWPEPGPGPLGSELVLCPARTLAELYEAASELAVRLGEKSRHGGIVFVRIPPGWLAPGRAPDDLFRWLLLLTSANRRDLGEAHELARTLLETSPRAEIGVTIHGVESIAQARGAFDHLTRIGQEQLGLVPISYGLLVDDLHVYRAIAAQRPIGLAHPQAPATRALRDVARLLYEDARSRVLG